MHSQYKINVLLFIDFRLARRDEFEQMQVEFNSITTACIRCNTSTQILTSVSQGKAAMYYCAKYMSKPPFQLRNILPLFAQAEEEYKKYGSKANDNGIATRKAKNILQKVLNKSGLIEISDQQATAAVMGKTSALSTHKFSIINPWHAVYHHHRLFNQYIHTQQYKEQILSELAVDSNNNKAISISTFEIYLSRGEELRLLNQYDYSLHIGKIKIKTNKKKRTYNPGRKVNKTFFFDSDSKVSKCYKQIIKSCPEIPLLVGIPPPKYPGDKPIENKENKEKKKWYTEAKIFVEFYSLLFLPLKRDGTPIKPYENILPWKENISWNNFWKIFNSFENATTPYKRSIWCIFQNMVDSLHQNTNERKLVTKWRFLTADKRTHDNISIISKTKNLNHNQDDKQQNIDENENDMTAICEAIRAKHGADDFLSKTEIEIKKSIRYLKHQTELYNTIQKNNIYKEPQKRFPTFNATECKNMLHIKDDIQDKENCYNHKEINKNDSTNIILKINSPNDIILKPHQEKAVQQLKYIKNENNGCINIKPHQLLAILQGVPGAGKTVTATQVAKKLGLRTLFSGTTSTAAAQLKAETINTILGLGLNKNDFKNNNIPYETKQKIIQRFQDIDLLIIDEISMLTPVTLCRIDYYLRTALESDYLFGGLDILLIGDMWQFPPVSPGLAKPSLYQGAVMLGLGLRLPNDAYRIGSSLFTKFRLVILDGQVRASNTFNKWLSQLRNTDIEYPITDKWLSELTTLTTNDFKNKNINWTTTGIVVSGNAERYKFIKEKIITFGIKYNEPILCWSCPVKVSKNNYEPLPLEMNEIYDELIRYFARGASCVLTESINTKIGLGKGSECVYIDAVWKENDININSLPPGVIKVVPQPDYLVIQVQQKKKVIRFAIKPTVAQFKDKSGLYKKCLQHECELSGSVTFHKMQGKTVKSTILSLNARAGISKRIYPISLSSIYVGCSRVYNHNFLRILPLYKVDK